MDRIEEIESLLGRKIDFEEVSFNGKKGILPIYFSYNGTSFISSVLSDTQEEAEEKFISYLKTVKKGEINDNRENDPPNDRSSSENNREDQST